MFKLLLLFLFSTVSTLGKNIILKKGNHLFITNTVDSDSKEFFISGTKLLTDKDIYIYISSNGGSVIDGNDIIETINFLVNSGLNVQCIAQKAYSMAFHILQHCPRRLITKSSSLMQHQMKLGVYNNYENIKTYLEMIEQINQNHINHSAQRLNMTSLEFKNRINNDWWVFGSNIIDNKMADEIVSVGCDKELFNLNYNKPKKELDLTDLFSENDPIINLNGCPLLH